MTAQHPRRPRTASGVAVVLPRLEATPEWMAVGACRFVDPDLFYPEHNNLTRDPKRVCARCDVAEQCLQWALITNEPHGIWGGQSAGERKSLVEDVRRWAVATGARCPASGGISPELLAAYEEAQHGGRVAIEGGLPMSGLWRDDRGSIDTSIMTTGMFLGLVVIVPALV